MCPYFVARKLLKTANIVVFSYQYLLDPKVSGLVLNEVSKDSLVVFDDAHNIDDACIENLTIRINKGSVLRARASLEKISTKINDKGSDNLENLDFEYQNLVQGLGQSEFNKNHGDKFYHPKKDFLNRNSDLENLQLNVSKHIFIFTLIGEDIFEGAMPGNLRKSTDFVAFLKRALHYIDIAYLKKKEVSIESTRTFLDGIKLGAHCEEAALKYIDRRLHILLQTLQLTDSEEISTLLLMSQFLTLASTQQ
jgi:DNA excision repair protein ERCC-2